MIILAHPLIMFSEKTLTTLSCQTFINRDEKFFVLQEGDGRLLPVSACGNKHGKTACMIGGKINRGEYACSEKKDRHNLGTQDLTLTTDSKYSKLLKPA